MSTSTEYAKYASDAQVAADYVEYQQRYIDDPRESDKVTVSLVAAALARSGGTGHVLDLGCSTGNLLRLLAKTLPGARLAGGDLMQEALDECRSANDLADVRFDRLDALQLPYQEEFDAITLNVVAFVFSNEEFAQAVKSIYSALAPGGTLVVFDFFHPHNQDLAIRETTGLHPEGITLHFRPYRLAQATLESAGFADVSFRPFEIPLDLAATDEHDGMTSYTRRDEHGQRMVFRGALAQPWCHLVARRPE
jgi:SAM-dependent methyltransferase